jgi:MFS family permease
VNWPTGPPPMPSSGWYSDPEQDSTWRWWDGRAWTDHRSPMWERPAPGPPSLSAWFDRLVRCVKWVVRRVGLVLMGVAIVVGSMVAAVTLATVESDRGRELRRLVDDDLSASTSLTDAEADRAWELVVSLFWSVLPWAIVIFVVYVVVAAWAYALVAQVAATTPDDRVADTDRLDGAEPTVGSALRRAPAVIGAGLVLAAIGFAVLAAVSLPVVLVALSDAGGAAIGLTVFFGVIAGVVVGAWLWVRLGLTVVLAALGGYGLGIGQSWTLTQGRYWFVFVRLLMATLIGAVIGVVTNVVTNGSSFVGFAVASVILLVLAVVVEVVRTIVSASAHVVTIEQIDESSRSTGSSVPGGHT